MSKLGAAAAHEIEVEIDEAGHVTLEAHGMVGRACSTVLRDFAKALGGGVVAARAKPAMRVAVAARVPRRLPRGPR